MILKTQCGKRFRVDNEDYHKIKHINWVACDKYIVGICSIKNRRVRLHRLLLNVVEDLTYDVDHIDGDPTNNSKVNLRLITRSENIRRARIDKTNTASKYYGVCWKKDRKKWHVKIKINNKYRHVGYYIDEIEAAKAYDSEVIKLVTEHARLNFPNE